MSKRYIDADKFKKDLIHLGFLPALVTSTLDKQPTANVIEVEEVNIRVKNTVNRIKELLHAKEDRAACSVSIYDIDKVIESFMSEM